MRPNNEMVAAHAVLLCKLSKQHQLITIESESRAQVTMTRCFSARDPAEIAAYVLAENARDRNVFVKMGATLHKAAGGDRAPFAGTISRTGKGAPFVVGAPAPESHEPPPAPRPQSFLRMKGFA